MKIYEAREPYPCRVHTSGVLTLRKLPITKYNLTLPEVISKQSLKITHLIISLLQNKDPD